MIRNKSDERESTDPRFRNHHNILEPMVVPGENKSLPPIIPFLI
jgi:hypothetical protein